MDLGIQPSSTLQSIENPYPAIHSKYLSAYTENAFPQLNWALSFMRKFDLKGVARIIDVGCRTGAATMELARHYPETHVVGIDGSIPFLETANENLAKHALPNLEFRLMDPLQMDFQGKIDVIVSFSFLHWIKDKLTLLKGMKRSLKPEGRAYLSFFANHQRERFDTCLTEVSHYEKWSPYFADEPIGCNEIQGYEWAQLVYETGFILDKFEFVEIHDHFNSQNEFAAWLTTWIPHLKLLPEELHEPFLADVIQYYLKYHPMNAEGIIHRKDYMLEAVLLNKQ